MSATKEQSLTDLTDVCGALSDETRMRIVFLLAKGDHDVSSLRETLKRPEPNVSYHLALLRMNRLVVAKRTGRQIFYSLAENIRASGGKLKISLGTGSVTVAGR